MEGDRRVGVAVDFSPCSKKALKWAVDNLIRNGDHLILLTIRPEGNYETGEMQLWEVTGSRNHSTIFSFLSVPFSRFYNVLCLCHGKILLQLIFLMVACLCACV